MSRKIKLLKRLIEGDKLSFGFMFSKYTHEKKLSDLGDLNIDWIELAETRHIWFEVKESDKQTTYSNNLIRLEGDKIEYTPEIIQDFINKNDF